MRMSPARHCHYCKIRVYKGGTPEASINPDLRETIDHKRPKRLYTIGDGGKDNRVISCEKCNAIKADGPYEAFIVFIAEFRGSRIKGMREFALFCHELARAGLKAAHALHVAETRKSRRSA